MVQAGGLDVEIVPLPGSTDCVKSVATGQLLITLPSVEPLAIVRPQGLDAKKVAADAKAYTYAK